MASNYVSAGLETIAEIIYRFVHGDEFNNHFSADDLSKFFAVTCNKFLHSFGQNLKPKKKFHKYKNKEASLLYYCRDVGWFDDSELIVDSGGYQISVGILDELKCKVLVDLYHEFLQEYVNIYDKAFILDVPPGPGCVLYDNFNQVYEMNKKTYDMAVNLPSNVRDKLIYIHHFRTPKLWEIYTRILDEGEMFDKFNYHATGGVVVNQRSDVLIPCIIYILPIIPLINRAKACGRTHLEFHILGGSSFRDILFYELFSIHVMKIHGIDLKITYDSSSIYKSLMIGRQIYILNGEIVYKTCIRTASLETKWSGETTVIQAYRNAIQEMSRKHGLQVIPMEYVYDPKTGTFPYELRLYTSLYVLYFFAEMQEHLKKKAKEVYPIYESGETTKFINEVGEILKNLNHGNMTAKTRSKSNSIPKSLDMLTDLDESYCKYIVDRYLARDEFLELSKKKGPLTI